MSRQSKNTHQQDQYGRPVLNVVIQLTGDPTQTEEPDHLERAEQTADPLKGKRRGTQRQKGFNEKVETLKSFYSFIGSLFSRRTLECVATRGVTVIKGYI